MSEGLTDVLFLAYYFPPVGGAGVQRSLKFARYLPEEGFRPVVVTGTGATNGRWEPSDDTLAAELSDDVPVYRAERAFSGSDGRSRLDRWLGRPGGFTRWWTETILETGRRAAAASDPRVVYVSLSPYEGLAPALELGAELGLPVLADLRDPWALDEVRVYPTAWHRKREVAAMRRLFAHCSRILMNTPEAASAARATFAELPPDRFHWLTNGFDREDFAGLAPRRPDGKFRILHTGYLHTGLGLAHRSRGAMKRMLGGELAPVDFLSRSHVFLLEALERLEREKPGRTAGVEVVLAGVLSEADERIVRDSPAGRLVVQPGYLDHRQAVRAMVEADLLFLPMHALPDGYRARIVPGKTYEYLASGRPILAALPEGDARDFVTAADAGPVVAPSDVAAMARAIEEQIERAPTARRELDESVLRFDRRRLTQELATHLRAVTGTPARHAVAAG